MSNNEQITLEGAGGMGQKEFKFVFDQYYVKIRNFIYYKSGDMAVSEDISQETFLKIWEMRQKVKMETIQALLYKIAGNILINKFKHQKIELKFAKKKTEPGISESADFEMEMHEFDMKLQKALSDLSEKNRVVFLMNRIDNITYKEIAEKLDISVKAVEKRMNHALTFLREKLAKTI